MPWFTRVAIALTPTTLFLVGCSSPGNVADESQPSDTATVTVYTVNYPLKYFADRIGGEHVNVVFPAPRDEDPAFWTPDAETVSAFQKADLILLNGATYAKWVSKVTLPASKLLNTTKAVQDKYIAVKDAVTHSHGPGEKHSHEGTAFTTWLDPNIAIVQSSAIHRELVELRPAHKELFDENFELLKSDLEALDQKLNTLVSVEQPVVFSHPVFQYLERRYEINGRSVHWEPESIPSQDAWVEFRELLKSHPAKWMIWEGEPIDDSVKRLSQLGIRSVVFDPCGTTPGDGDWLVVMNRNTNELARVYSNLASD